MGRFPVTNAQFRFFMDAGGYADEKYWEEAIREKIWNDGMVKGYYDEKPRNHPRRFLYPYGLPNHPVVGVTWYEAMAFARWLEVDWRKRGLISEDWLVGLPTEAQWEKAARGGLKVPEQEVVLPVGKIATREASPFLIDNENATRKYPWGDDFDSEKMNMEETDIGTTSTPGCFFSGKSPCGCEEMCGNVLEWTRSERKSYPYEPGDGREDTNLFIKYTWIVFRGCHFSHDDEWTRCGFRIEHHPYFYGASIGFRILLSPP